MANPYIVLRDIIPENLEKELNKHKNYVLVEADKADSDTFDVIMQQSTVEKPYKVLLDCQTKNMQLDIAKYPNYYIIDVDRINNDLFNIILREGGEADEEGISGIMIGYIGNGDHFPTKRPDGRPLCTLDYVHVKQGSTFPFTVDGLTFSHYSDIGYYDNGYWYVCSGGTAIASSEAYRYSLRAGTYATEAGNKAIEAMQAAEAAKNVVWRGTQAEYNALTTINPDTIYFIVG